jgi:hypothetical protein
VAQPEDPWRVASVLAAPYVPDLSTSGACGSAARPYCTVAQAALLQQVAASLDRAIATARMAGTCWRPESGWCVLAPLVPDVEWQDAVE